MSCRSLFEIYPSWSSSAYPESDGDDTVDTSHDYEVTDDGAGDVSEARTAALTVAYFLRRGECTMEKINARVVTPAKNQELAY